MTDIKLQDRMTAEQIIEDWLNAWDGRVQLTTAQRVGIEDRIESQLTATEAVVEAALQVDARVGPHTNEHEQALRDALSSLDASKKENHENSNR